MSATGAAASAAPSPDPSAPHAPTSASGHGLPLSSFWQQHAFTLGGIDFLQIDVALAAMVFGEWARFEKRLAEGLACDARATVEPFCFDVLLLLIEQCGERGQVGSDVGVIRSERLFGHRDRFEENRFRIPTPSALLEQIAEVHERASAAAPRAAFAAQCDAVRRLLGDGCVRSPMRRSLSGGRDD
jgi:hypothetical protein